MAEEIILKKTIRVEASLSKTWDTLTNPDLIKQWLFRTTVISDWKVGSPSFLQEIGKGQHTTTKEQS